MTTNIETTHAALVSVAEIQNCTKSVLTETNVSVHTLPQTTSFANIAALVGSTKTSAYIGTVESDLVFSSHLNPSGNCQNGADAGADADAVDEDAQRPAKRRRDSSGEEADRVAAARWRLAKSVPSLPSDELDVAQRVLTRFVRDLRGPNGEIVVQSYAILSKKLGVADTRPRVVVAARLNAGIELKVELLKSCLGGCWEDGLLTTLPTLQGIGKLELPLSDEAATAALFGNVSILLVTSVPPK